MDGSKAITRTKYGVLAVALVGLFFLLFLRPVDVGSPRTEAVPEPALKPYSASYKIGPLKPGTGTTAVGRRVAPKKAPTKSSVGSTAKGKPSARPASTQPPIVAAAIAAAKGHFSTYVNAGGAEHDSPQAWLADVKSHVTEDLLNRYVEASPASDEVYRIAHQQGYDLKAVTSCRPEGSVGGSDVVVDLTCTTKVTTVGRDGKPVPASRIVSGWQYGATFTQRSTVEVRRSGTKMLVNSFTIGG